MNIVPVSFRPDAVSDLRLAATSLQRFDAAAFFRAEIDGLEVRESHGYMDFLVAYNTLAAARKWYWRLKPTERHVLNYIVVRSPTLHCWDGDIYCGAPVAYTRDGNQLVEIAFPDEERARG